MPRNGAEQGVASTAAKAPAAKSPACPPRPCASALCQEEGRAASQAPASEAANSARIRISAARNTGDWNCTPQPTDSPAARAAITTPASAIAKAITPAAEARNPVRTRAADCPAPATAPASLIVRTGSTQGIRFRISPPRNAAANAPRRGAVARGGAGGAAASGAGKVAARAPSTIVRSMGVTSIGEGGTVTGRRAQSVRPPSASRMSGAPKPARPASGNTSGARRGGSAATSIVRASSDRCAARSVRPAASAVPGTRAAAAAIMAAAPPSTPAPAGRSSASSAVSGTQISAQTRRRTSARSRADAPGSANPIRTGNSTVSA